MDRDDVEVLKRRSPYRGYFRIDHYLFRHTLHQGGQSAPIEREVLERGHAVAVVLYDPRHDEFVMVEQFRIGAYTAGWRPWTIEMVAGLIGPGEEPVDVALREAHEEAGVTPRDPVYLCRYLTSPGCSSETVEIYAAQVDAAKAHGVHGLDHEGEDIRVMRVPSLTAYRWVEDGTIDNGMTMIALDRFRARAEELRRRWLAEP